MTHDLRPIGWRTLHPVEAMIVAVVTRNGQWIRQCTCGLLINGLNEVDVHCHYREHLAAVKAAS